MLQIVEIVEAVHTTKGARKTYHVKDASYTTIGTIDYLPTGKFKSYVVGTARLHNNLTAALVCIQSQ